MEQAVRIAICTTVFPAVLPYWKPFLDSLKNQERLADLIVVNDGIDRVECLELNGYPAGVVVFPGAGNAVQNRMLLVHNGIALGYDWLVFADADDFSETNRIRMTLECASGVDCVINELAIVDGDGNLRNRSLWSSRIGDRQRIDFGFLLDANIAGLSNTAIRASSLRGIEIPESLEVADWYLFSRALYQGASAIFLSSTRTYYRQYGGNLAGAMKAPEPSMILRAIGIKKAHYEALERHVPEVGNRARFFRRLHSAATRDSAVLERYCGQVPRVAGNAYFWWEFAPYIETFSI